MSHFTTLDRAEIVSADAFIKACGELGLTDVQRDCKITDYYGKTIDVDVAVKTGKYSLALKKNANDKYDMVSDWWGVRGEKTSQMKRHGIRTDEDLQDYLLRHSTKHTIVDRYKRQGFRADVTEDQEKNMNLTLTRAY